MIPSSKVRKLENELTEIAEREERLAERLKETEPESAHVLRQIAATLYMVVGKLHKL